MVSACADAHSACRASRAPVARSARTPATSSCVNGTATSTAGRGVAGGVPTGLPSTESPAGVSNRSMRGSFEPDAQPGKRRGVRAVRVAVAKRRVVPGKMTRSYWRRKEVEL